MWKWEVKLFKNSFIISRFQMKNSCVQKCKIIVIARGQILRCEDIIIVKDCHFYFLILHVLNKCFAYCASTILENSSALTMSVVTQPCSKLNTRPIKVEKLAFEVESRIWCLRETATFLIWTALMASRKNEELVNNSDITYESLAGHLVCVYPQQ